MVYYLFENIRARLCLSQSQALLNDNLQMCRERIDVNEKHAKVVNH